MKRTILLCALFLSSLLLADCKLDDGDDRDSFPKVDVTQFIKSGEYVFPKGTSALQLYNAFIYQSAEGEYSVTGMYRRTETALLLGKKHTETISKVITKVKIYRSKTEISNRFHVDFVTDKNEVLANYYSWQRHRSNVWHNNKIDGDIVIQHFNP